MSLRFPCGCGRLLQVGVELAGKRVRCPSCSAIVWAPAGVEQVPEARLVDPEVKPAPVPVASQGAPIPPPVPGPVPAAGSPCCSSAGFVVALASLVFGVVTMAFPVSWPAGGLVGALVSYRTLRRVRSGALPVSAAPLARAGFALGMGQAVLGIVALVGLATLCLKDGSFCRRGRELRCTQPLKRVESREIRVVPVPAHPQRATPPDPERECRDTESGD